MARRNNEISYDAHIDTMAAAMGSAHGANATSSMFSPAYRERINSPRRVRRQKSRTVAFGTEKKSGLIAREVKKYAREHPIKTVVGGIALTAAAISYPYAYSGDTLAESDNCTSPTKQQVVINTPFDDYGFARPALRAGFESIGVDPPQTENGIYPRTSHGLVNAMESGRGYFMSDHQFRSMNQHVKDADGTPLFSRSDGKLDESFNNDGEYCVEVPAPIRSGTHLITENNTTIENLATGYKLPIEEIHQLNPALKELEKTEALPIGTTVNIAQQQGELVLQASDTEVMNEYLTQPNGHFNKALWQEMSWDNRAYNGITAVEPNDELMFMPYGASKKDERVNTDALDVTESDFFKEHPEITASAIMQANPQTAIGIPTIDPAQGPKGDKATETAGLPELSDFNANRFTEIDMSKHAEAPHWDESQLERINDLVPAYAAAARQYDLPWQMLAAIHYRETSLSTTNPSNGQGIFQFYGHNEFSPGAVNQEGFEHQLKLVAGRLRNEYIHYGYYYSDVPLTASLIDPRKVKDVFFSYNGRADGYVEQAKELGFKSYEGAEGSPYVMNLADDRRNSAKNPTWNQYLTDGGGLGLANQQPGAWVLFDELMKVTGADSYAKLPINYNEKFPYHSDLAGEIVSYSDSDVPLPKSIGRVTYYSQWDKRWYDRAYNPPGINDRTMASSGCAPTSIAMVISTLSSEVVTPVQIADWAIENDYRYDGGTNHEAFITAPELYNLKSRNIDISIDAVREILKQDGLVIINGDDSDPETPATTAGHIYVIQGINDDGKFLVADPNSVTKSLEAWEPSIILNPAWKAIGVTT